MNTKENMVKILESVFAKLFIIIIEDTGYLTLFPPSNIDEAELKLDKM